MLYHPSPAPFPPEFGRFLITWSVALSTLRRLVASAVLLSLLAVPAMAQNFPRLGLYGSMSGTGAPYLNTSGQLDNTVLDAVSRYNEVILDASPISEYHPEIASALRSRNPGIKLLAYVLGNSVWNVVAQDSLVHYPTRYYRLVRDMNGFLYNKNGAWFGTANVNIAKKDANGRFALAESIVDLWMDAIVRTGTWDGMFLDVYCSDITWAQWGTDSIDFVRAGYPDQASFATAWRAAADTMSNRLRRLTPANYILVGNCATGSHYHVFRGWMRENFPYQNGGTWWDNMLGATGYLADDSNYVAPPHNYLFSAVAGSLNYDSNNARKVRLGLGSAAMGQGFGVFGPSNRNWQSAPYHMWWYDEYAVNRITGRSSTLLQDVGWLGAPTSAPYQMVWVGTNADAATNPGFEPAGTTGWTMWNGGGAIATLTRDSTQHAMGAASGRIHIDTPSTLDWYVTTTTSTSINVTLGQSYAATFWARASSPRAIVVAAAKTTSGGWDARTLNIDTGWKRYQVVLNPNGTGLATLQFQTGRDAGDVWIDDVHFQQGITSIWRRDFQYGAVLLNPGALPLTVPLGVNYRHILGTVDPLTNNGLLTNTVTVGYNDALFLLNADNGRPAPIRDLHFGP